MLKRSLAVTLFCGVLAFSVSPGSARGFSFHASAGPSILTGDISDLWNTGLSIRGYGYNRLNSNFILGLGMDVNWHTMNEEAFYLGSVPSGWSASGDLFMIEAGPTLRYLPESMESRNVRYFGEAALSFYRMGWTTTVDGTYSGYGFNGSLSGDKNQFGLTLGGGVSFGRFEISPLLHFPFDDDMYFTLNGGIRFGR
jgi:hypothetical protein